MCEPKPFSPQDIFAGSSDESSDPPRVMISPHRYIQGRGVLDQLGRYISIISGRKPVVLMTERRKQHLGQRIEAGFLKAGVKPQIVIFQGECSVEEVERIVAEIPRSGQPADSLIAVGGGKCLDAGKCVAFRLGVPLVICPTIASTDAPCSAVSVLYTKDGVGIGPEFFPNSPALVVVDTQVIADSPLRHFIAGMGDALATYYEARTCFRNPSGRNMVGARITIAALGMAELCAKTIFENASRAILAVSNKKVDESVERVVEANTLLSGMGFESGGLAAAHAIAAGLTVIPFLHREYLHGELVGIGLISQLILENDPEEARRVARFLAEVGLPISLDHLRLDFHKDSQIIMEAMTSALKEPFANNEPFELSPEKLSLAFGKADLLGRAIVADIGDRPFRKIHTHA
jgi:glycerol dehydrogenase